MYRFSYAETMESFSDHSRGREKMAIDYVIGRLEAGLEKGLRSPEAVQAMHETRRLWAFFLEDLAKRENELPEALRADLISIGLFILKELERIRREESDDLSGIIEINTIIRDGLN